MPVAAIILIFSSFKLTITRCSWRADGIHELLSVLSCFTCIPCSFSVGYSLLLWLLTGFWWLIIWSMLYLASLLNACCFCCYLCITCLYFYLLVTNDVYCWFHRRVSCCITMLHNYLHFSCLCNCYSVTYYADWPWLFPWLRNCYLLDYALCRGSLDSCTLCALICCLLATVFSLCLLCVLSSLSCNSDVFQYVIGVLLLPLLCYLVACSYTNVGCARDACSCSSCLLLVWL